MNNQNNDVINQRIEIFKSALGDRSQTDHFIVQKYITHGTPYIFKNNEDLYFDLKYAIANKFGLKSPEMVRMVGSAKLGFSISPKKVWKHFSEDDSDIDMVIISRSIFESFWTELYDFNIDLTSRKDREQEKYNAFKNYFFKGWLRPDLFPFNFGKRNEWFDFFKSISYGKYGKPKIAGAIYYDFSFFEKYHIKNIHNLREETIKDV